KEGITFGERSSTLRELQAARLTRTRTADGKLVDTCYWYSRPDGSFALRMRVDANGWVTEEVELSPEGAPRLGKDGDHRVVRTYNARGNNLTAHFFGIDGKPTLSHEGYHSDEMKYDERGNTIDRRFCGIDGKPCLIADGYYQWTSKYDGRDNAIQDD